MKKKFLSALMCATMALSLVGCGMKSPTSNNETTGATNSTPTTKAEVTLVYAEVNPLDTIVGQTASAFKEKVEELSGGKIAIDLQHSGVLDRKSVV